MVDGVDRSGVLSLFDVDVSSGCRRFSFTMLFIEDDGSKRAESTSSMALCDLILRTVSDYAHLTWIRNDSTCFP